MKVCLTGGTGFLGSRISRFFKENGYDVVNISRKDFEQNLSHIAEKIEGADLLINLAGASILKKWTTSYKKEIYNSRINTTRKLVDAFRLVKSKPPIVLSASAVGIYDEYEVHDEFSDQLSHDYLAGLCKDWEAAVAPLVQENVRLAIIRIGVVLDKNGGALAKMLPSFKCGAGAIIGDGHQSFPFIHINDLLSAIWYIFKNDASKGVYNLVAPEIISNRYFSKLLGKKLHRPVWLKLPKSFIKIALGDGAVVLIKGQKVVPQRLFDLDFPFQFPDLNSALNDII